ncbi:MAG: hypothetical protein JJU20_04690 [Opitutales bacterium]|nr:hypothetical protein [Opitutales bacterium]
MNTPLSLFSEKDQDLMKRIYERLFELFKVLKPMVDKTEVTEADMASILAVNVGEVPGITRDLGIETLDGTGDERLPRAIHDIRGGCLAAVVSCYDLIARGIFPWQHKTALQLFRMVRDHLKMFRNCVPEIDLETVNRDRADRGHSIELLTEKWQDAAYQVQGGRAVNVRYSCDYVGTVSERCMEFSALDRIVYNCMNNAGRFAVDNRVDFHIFEVDPQASTKVLRFVLINKIEPGHAQTLKERFGDDLSSLFNARQSADSSGYGLNICADFVASAFGLKGAKSAIEQKYIGVAVQEDCFILWFHWPSVV